MLTGQAGPGDPTRRGQTVVVIEKTIGKVRYSVSAEIRPGNGHLAYKSMLKSAAGK